MHSHNYNLQGLIRLVTVGTDWTHGTPPQHRMTQPRQSCQWIWGPRDREPLRGILPCDALANIVILVIPVYAGRRSE